VADHDHQVDDGAFDWRHPPARLIVGGLITIVALLFVFQNTGTGTFHFLFFAIEAPRWLWLLGVFAAGVATGLLVARHRTQDRTPTTEARADGR